MPKKKQQCERESVVGLLFFKKKCFKVGFEGVQRGFLSERKWKVIPPRRAEDRKGTRSNQWIEANISVVSFFVLCPLISSY